MIQVIFDPLTYDVSPNILSTCAIVDFARIPFNGRMNQSFISQTRALVAIKFSIPRGLR